ncbi:hypothetical protein PUG81_05100 [Erwiniaceae bacterium L1_54_6]|nr:hypothetical protein [Erwiniaceae bacterium L1_54_6]
MSYMRRFFDSRIVAYIVGSIAAIYLGVSHIESLEEAERFAK